MKLVKHEDGERFGIWSPSTGLREITQEEYEQRQKSSLERFGGALGDTLQDGLGYGLDIIGAGGAGALGIANTVLQQSGGPQVTPANPVQELGRAIERENDERIAARGAIDEAASFAGTAAGLFVEGAATGGGGIAKGLIRSNADELAPAATRGGAGPWTMPDAPTVPPRGAPGVSAAQRGLRLGESVIDTAKNVIADIPGIKPLWQDGAAALARRQRDKLTNDGIGAERTTDPNARWAYDTMATDEVLEFGEGYQPEIPQSMRMSLDAMTEGDSKIGRAAMAEELQVEQMQPGAFENLIYGERPSITGTQSDLQEMLNKTVMREIGAPGASRVSPSTVHDRMKVIGDEIDAIADRAGPMDAEGLLEEIDAIADDMVLSTEVRRDMAQVKEYIKDKTEADGTIAPEGHGLIRNRINDRIGRAVRSESDTEVADFLDRVSQKIFDRLSRNLSVEDLENERILRRQWGLSRSLTDSRTVIGENGVSPRNLLTAEGRRAGAGKVGALRGDLPRFLNSMEILLRKPPSSGTAERVARAVAAQKK